MNSKTVLIASFLILGLGGCETVNDWFADKKPDPLPGKRLSVIELQSRLEPDATLMTQPVNLDAANHEPDWPFAGGPANHNAGHRSFSGNVKKIWSVDIGAATEDRARLVTQPVIENNRIYTMDAAGEIVAFDSQTGKKLWGIDTTPEKEQSGVLSGGIAVNGNRVFVTTGYAEILALDTGSGAVLWKKKLSVPSRAAPLVDDGRVYVQTVDNQTLALSAEDGATQWTHAGLAETAGLLGAPSPAIADRLLVVGYSSGELFGLRVENGNVAWNESLAAIKRLGLLANLADIRAMPVIADDSIYAISHSGRMLALDAKNGSRRWQRPIGGVSTPAVSGDFVFVLSNENELLALTREDGRIRWVQQMERFENPEKRKDPIVWVGPVLAGGRLYLAGSTGTLLAIDPQDGKVTNTFDLPGAISIAPLVAGDTLYILTDSAELIAYR